ncbi:hypothetical protein S245_035502 [Arachis hypogaea]
MIVLKDLECRDGFLSRMRFQFVSHIDLLSKFLMTDFKFEELLFMKDVNGVGVLLKLRNYLWTYIDNLHAGISSSCRSSKLPRF